MQNHPHENTKSQNTYGDHSPIIDRSPNSRIATGSNSRIIESINLKFIIPLSLSLALSVVANVYQWKKGRKKKRPL